MEKFHFTLISGNQQFRTIRNVEKVSFGLNSTEAGRSKDEVDYANRKRKPDEAGLFPIDFACTY